MDYEKLAQHEASEVQPRRIQQRGDSKLVHRLLVGVLITLITSWLLFAYFLLSMRWQAVGENAQFSVWSPLIPYVQYEERRFNQGFWGEKTAYMGAPNVQNEKAWHDLSQHGMVAISESQASQLRDPTAPWLDNDDGLYVVGVEMYHQLHCLNRIRLALWDDTPFHQKHYKSVEEAEHIDHCVDYLRQVIVCHWDIGLVPFRLEGDSYLPNFNQTRVCRKHEPLLEWADAYQAGDNVPE